MDFYIDSEIKRFSLLILKIDTVYHEMALKLGNSESELLVLYIFVVVMLNVCLKI